MERDLQSVQNETTRASDELMMKAYNAMQSDTIKHLVRIQEILDDLAKVNGTLVKYEVKGSSLEWEALIPPAFANDFGKPQGIEQGDGRVRVKGNR